jgi:TolA-binding protein
MVGSLELAQLGDPGAARARFERYLESYRRGRQREGAYLLLCRAFAQRGERERARAVAARYLAEFPRGQFVERMRATAGSSKR